MTRNQRREFLFPKIQAIGQRLRDSMGTTNETGSRSVMTLEMLDILEALELVLSSVPIIVEDEDEEIDAP